LWGPQKENPRNFIVTIDIKQKIFEAPQFILAPAFMNSKVSNIFLFALPPSPQARPPPPLAAVPPLPTTPVAST